MTSDKTSSLVQIHVTIQFYCSKVVTRIWKTRENEFVTADISSKYIYFYINKQPNKQQFGKFNIYYFFMSN